MEDTLSLKDIARYLERPESTVRHWRDTFEDYLPIQGTGRARRYPFEALAVFESIAAGYAEGLATEAVEARLNATYPKAVTIDVTAKSDEHNATTAMQPQAFEQGQAILAAFAFMESQRSALDEARREIEKLRKSLEEMAAAHEAAERMAQAENERREERLKAWMEERLVAERRPTLAERLRRMLRR